MTPEAKVYTALSLFLGRHAHCVSSVSLLYHFSYLGYSIQSNLVGYYNIACVQLPLDILRVRLILDTARLRLIVIFCEHLLSLLSSRCNRLFVVGKISNKERARGRIDLVQLRDSEVFAMSIKSWTSGIRAVFTLGSSSRLAFRKRDIGKAHIPTLMYTTPGSLYPHCQQPR